MTITEYRKKGKRAYKVQGYLGIDPMTGKEKHTMLSGFRTSKEAELAFIRKKEAFRRGELASSKEHKTFHDVYLQWLEGYKNTVKESTLLTVQNHFRLSILPAFGEKRIQKITPAYAQKVVNSWYESKNHYRILASNTSRIFDFALLHGFTAENPIKKIILPKKKDEIQKDDKLKCFTKEELATFLKACKKEKNPMWFPFFRLLAYSGMRKGEALALFWEDIDVHEGIVNITKNLSRKANKAPTLTTPKTKGSRRKIPLDQKTLEILKAWKIKQAEHLLSRGIRAKKKEQLLFHSQENGFLTPQIPLIKIKKICKKQDLPSITVHGLRHTHCTLLFLAGASIKEVQTRLGHATPKMTLEIYSHVFPDQAKETADLFSSYMEG